jgi:multidrug transporter EmrE-like cation transporter
MDMTLLIHRLFSCSKRGGAMRWQIVSMIIVSILLSSAAQLLLKYGASTPAIQKAIYAKSIVNLLHAMIFMPQIIFGLACFGLSLVLWIVILSQTDVSYAYPFVALGICVTMIAGWFFFDETIPLLRIIGIAIVVAGVITVAKS